MAHNRTLPFTNFKDKKETDIFVLYLYGNLILKKKDTVLYIECFLAKVNSKITNCSFNGYYENKVERIVIPFTKSLLFPEGTIFTSKGKVFEYPNRIIGDKAINGRYKFNISKLNSEESFSIANFREKISSGILPDLSKSNILHNLLIGYYHNKKSNIEFLLPSGVLFKYFFGFSTLTYDIVINNKIEDFLIKKKIIIDNVVRYVVFYDSNLISPDEAMFLSKYLFVKNNSAITAIKNVANEIFKNRIIDNNQKVKHVPFYFNFPLLEDLSLEIVGQFISKYGEVDRKFLVTNIHSISPVNKNVVFFQVENVILKDINDRGDNQSDDNTKYNLGEFGIKTRKIFCNDGDSSTQEETQLTSAINQEKYDIEEAPINVQDLFLESPFFDATTILNLGNSNNNEVFVSPPSPDKVKDSNTLKNYIQYPIKWFDVVQQAMDMFSDKEKIPVVSTSTSVEKRDFDIHEIKYGSKYYYLLEFGNGYFSPIIKKDITSESITLETINEIVKESINHKLSWPEIKSNNSLAKFNIVFLMSNKHMLYEKFEDGVMKPDYEKMVLEVYEKTKNKIKKDLKF